MCVLPSFEKCAPSTLPASAARSGITSPASIHGRSNPCTRARTRSNRWIAATYRNAPPACYRDGFTQNRAFEIEASGRVVRSRSGRHRVRSSPDHVEISKPRSGNRTRHAGAQWRVRRFVLDQLAILDSKTTICQVVAQIVHWKRLCDDRIDGNPREHATQHLELLRSAKSRSAGVERSNHQAIPPQGTLRCTGERLVVTYTEAFGERVTDKQNAPIVWQAAPDTEAVVVVRERTLDAARCLAGATLDVIVGNPPLYLEREAVTCDQPHTDFRQRHPAHKTGAAEQCELTLHEAEGAAARGWWSACHLTVMPAAAARRSCSQFAMSQ